MTREEKEQFVEKSWEKYKNPSDKVPLPDLTRLLETQLDAMVRWFKYLEQEERRTNS